MRFLPKLFFLLAASFPIAPIARSSLASPAPLAPDSPTAGVVKRTLPNGLRVLIRPRHTAPVVTTMMWYRVGSRDELPGATGIAHFLEHLMFKGTRKLPKGAIDRITYQNGGSNKAFTFNDYTAYLFNLPRQNWKAALSIEADRMRNCLFDPKEFEAERQVVMEERRGGQDDPQQRFSEQLNALAFVAHPYRNPVIGWMEDLKRLTREEVYAFYRKYYVPANATLVITGDVTAGEALAAVRAAFSALPRFPAPQRPAVVEPPQIAARRLRMTLPTRVARLQAMFPTPPRQNPDSCALRVLQYLLAEGRLSRLYRRLVDRDQIAAAVDGSLEIYRDLGILTFEANAKEGVPLERLEAALWEELGKAAAEPASAKELERAKNQFFAHWIHERETAGDLAHVLGEADALGGHEYLTTLLSRVQAVTAADVQRVARTYLRRERSSIGYLEPKEQEPGGPALEAFPLPPQRSPRGGADRPVRPSARRRVPPRPLPAPPSPLKPLRPWEKVLPNGMRLVLLENHDLPTITLSTRVDAGSYQETDAQSGLANLVARMLDEGTRNRDHEEISSALEQVGASFSAAAGRATTYLTLHSLSRSTADLLPLYADLLRSPSFPADRLEQERSRVLVELKEEADDASRVAQRAFYDLVYGSHPAHRPVSGSEVSLRSLTRKDLADFHARFYRPDHTTLVAAGDFQAPDLLGRLEALFGDWAGGPGGLQALPAVRRQEEKRERCIPMEKTQTQIVLGHLGVTRNNPDYLALRVMDTILGEGVGGGFTARIPYRLRDVLGLAYRVGSSVTSTAAREPGVFIATLGTEPGKEKAAVAALLQEIRRIRSAPVTEVELKEAVNYLADSYVFDFQTHSQLADYLHSVLYYGLGYDYRRRFPAEVRKVTRADVLRAARKYLDPEHYTLVVVGPGQDR